jgi:hypothetical protein
MRLSANSRECNGRRVTLMFYRMSRYRVREGRLERLQVMSADVAGPLNQEAGKWELLS